MIISIKEINGLCANRWHEILPAFGIASELLDHKHHPCPVCGGKDRWRFMPNKSDGHNICNQCAYKSRDGLHLLKDFLGQSLDEVIQAIAGYLGITDANDIPAMPNPIQPEEKPLPLLPDLKKRERCARIWKETQPITLQNVAGRYLSSRGLGNELDFIDAGAVRFHQGLDYCKANDDGKGYTILGKYPCLVGRIQSNTGESLGLHITYLDQSGSGKANVPVPKQLKTFLPLGGLGAAIRLGGQNPIGGFIALSEGIETGLSAAFLNSAVPVWCAMNAGLIASFQPPESVESIVVFADNDKAGLEASEKLKERMLGRVDVQIMPPYEGNDWNDYLRLSLGVAA